MERPALVDGHLIELPGLLQDHFWVQKGPCFDLGISFLDMCKKRLCVLLDGQRACSDLSYCLCCRELIRIWTSSG